jgi:phosphoribosylamine--glycine ligase
MERHGIPTARAGQFFKSDDAHAFCQKMRYPVVIKADGLALGKGVIIAENPETAAKAIYRIMERREFGDAGRGVVIEEFLRGQECSVHALVDGKSFLLFPSAQDHKQAFDGDRGPNTGGMGTCSPTPVFDEAAANCVRNEVLARFMAGLAADQLPFTGLLFPGLMMTAEGPKVLEFNCRFGDPETQSLMLRLKSDLVDLLEAAIDGRLDQMQVEWDARAAVCVVMASGGYPGSYEKGKEITGLDEAGALPDVVVFHAGTALRDDRVVTSGGRVLGVCALGADLLEARERAYAAVGKIHFEGARWRTDIGARGQG